MNAGGNINVHEQKNDNGATDDRGLRLLRKLDAKVAKVAKAAERTMSVMIAAH